MGFQLPTYYKTTCKEKGASTKYFWKKSIVLLNMMIVTAYLHQTDTERLQPCCIAAVHKNHASWVKDLILQPQRCSVA